MGIYIMHALKFDHYHAMWKILILCTYMELYDHTSVCFSTRSSHGQIIASCMYTYWIVPTWKLVEANLPHSMQRWPCGSPHITNVKPHDAKMRACGDRI